MKSWYHPEMPTQRVNSYQRVIFVLFCLCFCCLHVGHLSIVMVVYWYVRISCVLWRGSELLTLINLKRSSYSNSAIGHIGAMPPLLDVVAPDMPSLTCPTSSFYCLPVCSMTNGLPFNSLLHPPKPLAPSQITWDTQNPFSHGSFSICGPPTAMLQPWGGHVHIIDLILLRLEATQC